MLTAVITGATSGIGKAMAEYLYEQGWNLILTGRNEGVLYELKLKYRDRCETLELDLSKENDCYKLYDFCKNKVITLFVNNAGFGIFGKFEETSLDKELDLINVNIRAVHILTKLFLKKFRRVNHGIILNVASSAAFVPGPLMSSYYASKSYVYQLSVAIAEELKREDTNVSISVLCPGPVNTNFNARAGVTFSVKPLSAEKVAVYAIKKALNKKTIIIPGKEMKLGIAASRLIPDNTISKFTYEIQKKKEY